MASGGVCATTCDPGTVRVRLLRVFASADYRPPQLPAVAAELLSLSQRQDVGYDQMVALLERDPVLAAKVLSICASAAYARGSPVLSLRQALVRLGLGGLRDVVLEASLHLRVFRVPGYDEPMARLARHSTVVARIMPALCRRAGVDSEYAFVCGLLHDVGIAACLLALADDGRRARLPFEALGDVLGGIHEEASGIVARLWSLPGEIQRVVASHHRLQYGGRPSPVNAALLVAEWLAGQVGATASPPSGPELDAQDPGEVRAARAFLGLDEVAMNQLRCDAAEIASAA